MSARLAGSRTFWTWLPVAVLPPVLVLDAALSDHHGDVTAVGVLTAVVACLPLVLRARLSFLALAPLITAGGRRRAPRRPRPGAGADGAPRHQGGQRGGAHRPAGDARGAARGGPRRAGRARRDRGRRRGARRRASRRGRRGHPPPLPTGAAAAQAAAYRIVQEALTNVLRHAGASSVWVRIGCDGEGIDVDVRDDGDARGGPGRAGHGIRGMQERAAALGAAPRAARPTAAGGG